MSERRCAVAELQDRINASEPGDVLLVEPGIYPDVSLTIHRDGKRRQPIVIRSASPGGVQFTGFSSIHLTGSFIYLEDLVFERCALDTSCILLDGTNDSRVTGCRFRDSGGSHAKHAAVSIQGVALRNTIARCDFAHLEQRSIQIIIKSEHAPKNNRIHENSFSDIPPIPSGNGRETIQIGQNQRDWGHVECGTIVERNRFARCDGEIEIISNKSSWNAYRYNLFKDCKGELVMRGGSHCEIQGNRHVGCTGGIRLSGTHHTVTHNLIERCANGIRIPYGMTREQGGLYQAVTECKVTHNTIQDSEKTGLYLGTNRMMDRKEMGIAKHPPYDNRFEKNVFKSDTGVHFIADEAPDNVVKDNVFTGACEGGEIPDGNVMASTSGLVDTEGASDLGADPDILRAVPPV